MLSWLAPCQCQHLSCRARLHVIQHSWHAARVRGWPENLCRAPPEISWTLWMPIWQGGMYCACRRLQGRHSFFNMSKIEQDAQFKHECKHEGQNCGPTSESRSTFVVTCEVRGSSSYPWFTTTRHFPALQTAHQQIQRPCLAFPRSIAYEWAASSEESKLSSWHK